MLRGGGEGNAMSGLSSGRSNRRRWGPPRAPGGPGPPTRRREVHVSHQSSICPRIWLLKRNHMTRRQPSFLSSPTTPAVAGAELKGQFLPVGDPLVPTGPQLKARLAAFWDHEGPR